MTQSSNNPFDIESLPRASIEMFCNAARIDLRRFHQDPVEIPNDMQIGQEIEVRIVCDVVDTNSGVGAHESQDKVILPLVLTGHSEKNGTPFFRIAQRVIRFRFVGEDFAVCWSAPDYNGSSVWYLGDDLDRMHWTRYTDIEGVRCSVPIDFEPESQCTIAMHPELVESHSRKSA